MHIKSRVCSCISLVHHEAPVVITLSSGFSIVCRWLCDGSFAGSVKIYYTQITDPFFV